MKRIFDEIKSFRLGYTEERPYPWRWTTPIVMCAFLLLSPFLALVNVPLSAYNIIQEFTYRPNDTLPAVFLGNLVPSVLQNPTDDFTPQLLNVGDVIMLEDHIFNYTIGQAFDDGDTNIPVSSFLYYNNPLSDGCDVANITVQLLLTKTKSQFPTPWGWTQEVQVTGTVVCYIPSLFYLIWELPHGEQDAAEISIQNMPFWMEDFDMLFEMWSGPSTPLIVTQVDISFTVYPCCDCSAVLAGRTLESTTQLLQAPCSSNPPLFVVVDNPKFSFVSPLTGPVEVVYIGLGPPPQQVTDVLAKSNLGNISISRLSTVYGNIFQSVYHLVRVDLGVIVENQIYNSPQMFNLTITSVGSGASEARYYTGNTALMAAWQRQVEFFQSNERVPPLEYLRSVPRLKPLGSAVTSVFVSTFAMISVMWTVFSLVAGALARSHSGKATLGKKYTVELSQSGDKRLESGMEELDDSEFVPPGQQEPDAVERLRQRIDREGVQMRVALARVSAALKKHGIMEDEIWDEDMVIG
ncbi:hypothetical protein C8R45DRAFT_1214759 [Mycena sanguinolenta]|nr:hypothetical protein C8R45DRAFT_1214759 [Mycena sanguinolenta]